MASESRRTLDFIALEQQLFQEPYQFDFFQALRLIENFYPEKSRIGYACRIKDEPVFLGQEPSLIFAPSTLASYQMGANGSAPFLSVFFFGLFGPNGPLPLHMTEYVRERMRNKNDYGFARFADIFHHRMLSLFYRAWANSEPAVQFDRPKEDKFKLYVGSLFGIGLPSLQKRSEVSDYAKLFFSGRFAFQGRNAEGLMDILEDFFSVPVEMDQFVGQWLEIPTDARWALGESLETSTLGETTTIGEHVWNCQFKFRILIGPIDFKSYLNFLPNKDSMHRLKDIVKEYIGDELDWDVLLTLKKEEVSPTVLGSMGELGWTSWLSPNIEKDFCQELLLDPLKN